MHIHNVYFWLNEGLADEALFDFEAGLELLSTDPSVRSCHYGKPADTHRDVVENSYSYGLVLVFDDRAAHDRYQEGAAHMRFLEMNMEKWNKVIVYDIQS